MENIEITHPYNLDERIALVRLNRPKVLNAINNFLLRELVDALKSFDADPKVRTIIITGSPRAFAAGADIAALKEMDPIDQLKDDREKLWKEFNQIKKPLIAAVDGYCLGGGHELAMSCDMVIASNRAKFGQPEINIGTIPGAGGTQRLTRIVGKNKAMMMVLTGELISADEALKWGLCAKVVPSHALMSDVFEIAKKIATKAPIAIQLAKEAVNKSFETSLKDGLEFERRNFYLTFASKDQKEGMQAFIEKRDPNYQGN